MKIFNLLEIKYNSFTTAVKNYLSKTLSNFNASYGNNTIFGQIINVLSASVQNIMLYIEDALTEQNKYTAQRKKSIYGLAALSGYNPSLGKATGVQLKINFTPSNTSNLNVFINNHESLTCTQNGLTYNLILPQEAIIMSIEKDNSVRYIYAVQGRFESQQFISSGGKYYTQNFNFLGNLDTDYLEIRINDEIWEHRDSLYDMDPDGKQYTYKVSPTGGVDLIFGNDKFGRALRVNDVIKITYLLHDGESGNLDVNTETYFVFNNMLKDISGNDVDGNSTFNVTFANNDSVTSGTNSESIEQVRQMIGLNSRSLVLAGAEHYNQFINKFSFCGYNRTWVEEGSMIVNSLIMKNYRLQLNEGKDYFNLKESDFVLTDMQKSSIKTCIENSGMQLAGTSYNIFDPELCKYALYIYVKLKSNKLEQSYITNQIRNLVGEFFSNVHSDIFIPKSDIVHLLKANISEIDSVDVYFLSEKNETALQTKQYKKDTYKFDPSLGYYKKYTEIVKIYEGENPNLGLDNHGNIFLKSNTQFPILMGGWDFVNKIEETQEIQEVAITDPLIIIYE